MQKHSCLGFPLKHLSFRDTILPLYLDIFFKPIELSRDCIWSPSVGQPLVSFCSHVNTTRKSIIVNFVFASFKVRRSFQNICILRCLFQSSFLQRLFGIIFSLSVFKCRGKPSETNSLYNSIRTWCDLLEVN